MSSQFTAILLMSETWALDADRAAAQIRRMFPQIGTVQAHPGHDENPASALLIIDGGRVVIQTVAKPYDNDAMWPPLKTLRIWDPQRTLKAHRAHLIVTCTGSVGTTDDAKAYAAATHFVAAALASCTPTTAVFWEPSFSLSRTRDFVDATALLLAGRMPLGAWISYASIVPKGYAPAEATGMVTYGMKPFIGRELELAPQRGDAKEAYRCISSVARMTLDKGVMLMDGKRLDGPSDGMDMLVRERNFWLRRNLSAYVLLTDTAVVNHDTLKPLAREPA